MAIDIQKLFNQDLPAKLAKYPDTAKAIGGKFQFNITGEDGGEWFIDASDSGPRVESGNPGQSDVSITMTSEDFQKYYENPQANGIHLLFAGKMKITGNPTLSMKMSKLFPLD